ncbi:hypothetical protein ACFZCP_39825 [Streptomyces sp. NPDC007971]|uniref:hypothetical protein n=1 Tax=Streptomyces sp. NPDC007971 TaxID=3364799 RepID=UPI0036E524DC
MVSLAVIDLTSHRLTRESTLDQTGCLTTGGAWSLASDLLGPQADVAPSDADLDPRSVSPVWWKRVGEVEGDLRAGHFQEGR